MKFVKSGAKRRRHKKNPAKSKARRTTRRARHNPAPSKVRSRRRHARRNPAGIDFKAFGLEIATVGAGALAAVYINNLAVKWIPVKFRGAASIGASILATMFGGRSQIVRNAAIGAGAMGVLDLLRSNVPSLVPLSAEDAGYLLGAAAAHDESIAAMFGADNANVPGVIPNVFGVDTGTVPMGEDWIPAVGADNANVPGVIPNVFGVDTGTVPMGDDEGGYLFEEDDDL